MFALGAIVIVAGFSFDQATSPPLAAQAATACRGADAPFRWGRFLAASAVLFSSFIGFDSIAQAGGEAQNPALAAAGDRHRRGRRRQLLPAVHRGGLPRGALAVHRQEARPRLTAPGLLGYLLSPGWTVAIVGGRRDRLINDLPAMLLAVSRLMFAWAEDGIFPRGSPGASHAGTRRTSPSC